MNYGQMPPRVKTQQPTIANISEDNIVPVPIETAYFLEDAQEDLTKPNRYYFDFPEEWATSNRGESIVGVRSIRMIPRGRLLLFRIGIRKYYKAHSKDNKSLDEI